MAHITVGIAKLVPEALLPQYGSDGAACFDIHALIEEPWVEGANDFVHVVPGTPIVFRTGLAFEIPDGFVMLVFSRSGHGFKNNVRLSNCTGIIDSDYRGELMVKLANDDTGGKSFNVRNGDRIAQAMIIPVPTVCFKVEDSLSTTKRGEAGMGSTGNGRNFIGQTK